MTTTQIIAVGNFLSSYESDLLYIKNVSKLSLDNCDFKFHTSTNKGSFKSFVISYGVAWNIEREHTKQLLEKVLVYLALPTKPKVDELVIKLIEDTHQEFAVSLASKILFLFKPEDFVPMDSLNKKAMKYKGRIYSEFKKEFDTFYLNEKNKDLLSEIIESTLPLAEIIEKRSDLKIDFELVRTNRLKDKLLWAIGKNM